MTERTKHLVKIFILPLAVFMVYPIALGFKIYYAIDTHQPEIEGEHYLIRTDFNAYLKKHNTGNRNLTSPFFGENNSVVPDNLKVGLNEFPFVFVDKESGSGVANADITMEISRTATVNSNRLFRCKTDSEGNCVMKIDLPAKGEWELLIDAKDADGRLTQLKKLNIAM